MVDGENWLEIRRFRRLPQICLFHLRQSAESVEKMGVGWLKRADSIASGCEKASSNTDTASADFANRLPAVVELAADFVKVSPAFAKVFPDFAGRLPASVGRLQDFVKRFPAAFRDGADFVNDRPAGCGAGAAEENGLENFENLPPASVVVR